MPGPVYYNDVTEDMKGCFVVGTVTMESIQAIRITGDNPTEKWLFGTLFNYEGIGNTEGASLPPIKTVNDVDLSTNTLLVNHSIILMLE